VADQVNRGADRAEPVGDLRHRLVPAEVVRVRGPEPVAGQVPPVHGGVVAEGGDERVPGRGAVGEPVHQHEDRGAGGATLLREAVV
jgi:hypothetical protein